jgi:RNA polymerase sigma-70 factor (ECF subfamily)
MTDTSIADLKLVNRILRRDESALSELYARYGAQVFGVVLHVLQNRDLAEEATQDTFLKVWNHVQQWDDERGKLSSWLLTVARYTAIDLLRREKRQAPGSAIDIEDMLSLIGQPGAARTPEWYDAELLKTLIGRLPHEQIEAIELAFFKGMTHSEIAAYLRQPLGTVKSRIRSGLQTLRGMWLQEMS